MSRRRVAISWEEHGEREGLEDGRKSRHRGQRGPGRLGRAKHGVGRGKRECVGCHEIRGLRCFEAGSWMCRDCRRAAAGGEAKRRCEECGHSRPLEDFEGESPMCSMCAERGRGRPFRVAPEEERRRIAEAIVEKRGYRFVDEEAREAMVVAMMWDGGK